MKRCFAKVKSWWVRRQDPARLARVYAEGQARYIIQGTLAIGLLQMLAHDCFGSLDLKAIVTGHFTGLVVSWLGWHDVENNYKSALNKARKTGVIAATTNLLGLRDS